MGVTAAFNLDIDRDTMQLTCTERSTKAYPITLRPCVPALLLPMDELTPTNVFCKSSSVHLLVYRLIKKLCVFSVVYKLKKIWKRAKLFT
jgi:hypothetical protein